MKKFMTFAIVLVFVLSANILKAQDQPEFKNYNMISGYVEYKLSGIQTGTMELYFEEYGKYESKATKGNYDYMGQKGSMNEVTIINPDGIFNINLDKAQGLKLPAIDWSKLIDKFETENGDFDKVQDQSMKEQGYIKKGTEKFLDRDCVIWELEKNGNTAKVWLWKGIELKTVQTMQGVSNTQEAVQVTEDATIPFSRFEVPEGITWLDPQTGQPIKAK